MGGGKKFKKIGRRGDLKKNASLIARGTPTIYDSRRVLLMKLDVDEIGTHATIEERLFV